MRSTRSLFGAVWLAGLMLAGTADAATLVVRASGPSTAAYPPGKMLPDSEKIMLKANDELVLLDAEGTRTLRGPGTFSALAAASPGTSGATALAALVDQRTDRRVRIGAVRGVDGKSTRPSNIWFIDASRSGTVCVPDGSPTMVWRADSDAAGTTMIAPAGGGGASVDWIAGQAVQRWPKDLPLTEGARYSLTTGTAAPTAITIVRIGREPDVLQDMAQTLITHGCGPQTDLLVAVAGAVGAAEASGQ